MKDDKYSLNINFPILGNIFVNLVFLNMILSILLYTFCINITVPSFLGIASIFSILLGMIVITMIYYLIFNLCVDDSYELYNNIINKKGISFYDHCLKSLNILYLLCSTYGYFLIINILMKGIINIFM